MRHLLRGLKSGLTERFRHTGIPTHLHVARLKAQAASSTLVRRPASLVYRSSQHADFIVLCAPRTGSTYLCTLLGSHPNVRMYEELFSTMRLVACPRIRRTPVQYLKHEVYSSYPPRVRAVGFKLIYYQARSGTSGVRALDAKVFSDRERERLERIWEYLRRRGDLRIIHLRRRNVVRTAASAAVAMVTQQWSRQAGARERNPKVSVTLEPAMLLGKLEETVETGALCERFFDGHPTADVWYEDLVDARDEQMARIHEFLGVPWVRPHSALVRQNPRPLRDMLSNYHELKASLSGTPWDGLLDQ